MYHEYLQSAGLGRPVLRAIYFSFLPNHLIIAFNLSVLIAQSAVLVFALIT
jgi:hypothetical protein